MKQAGKVLPFLNQLLANSGGGPVVSYVWRSVQLLLDNSSHGSQDIDDELGLKPRLEDYLHFVCYDGCEFDRIPADDRPFVLRQCFHSDGMVCWYNFYKEYPKQLAQHPLLALKHLLNDHSAILTKNDEVIANIAPLSLQSFALFRAQVYLQQALGRCTLLSYHYHTYLHCQQELTRIYGIPPVLSPGFSEPSWTFLHCTWRLPSLWFETFFEEYVPFFVFNELICDKYEPWFLVYSLAVEFQFPIGIQWIIRTVIEDNYLNPVCYFRDQRYFLEHDHDRYILARRRWFYQPVLFDNLSQTFSVTFTNRHSAAWARISEILLRVLFPPALSRTNTWVFKMLLRLNWKLVKSPLKNILGPPQRLKL